MSKVQPLTDTDRAFWQRSVDEQKDEFIKLVLRRRGVKLAAVGLGTAEEAAAKLFNGNAFTAHEAQRLGTYLADLGLVDNVGTFEEFISAQYPKHKVIDYFVDHQTFKNNETFTPPGLKSKNPNISLESSDIQYFLDMLMNVRSSTPESVSPLLTSLIGQMSPSDLNGLVSELSLVLTHQGYKNFKSNLV